MFKQRALGLAGLWRDVHIDESAGDEGLVDDLNAEVFSEESWRQWGPQGGLTVDTLPALGVVERQTEGDLRIRNVGPDGR